MLEGLFQSIAISDGDAEVTAHVELNDGHPVFRGHFPQKAVMPGVCQMYALRAVLSRHHRRAVEWDSLRDMKFLSPVLPAADRRLTITIRETVTADGKMKVDAVITVGNTVKTKIRAIFV